MNISEIGSQLRRAPVIPVLTVQELDQSLRLVEALVSKDTTTIEILFRTEIAPEVLRSAKARFPDCIFAAGTIVNQRSLEAAVEAGADFLVSPGLTAALHELVSTHEVPLVPGTQTASDVMFAVELGYDLVKYFPAEATNAQEVLNDFRAVFPAVRFIPTGKITRKVLPSYAQLPNVLAVGGSWMIFDEGLEGLESDIALMAAKRKAEH